MREREGQNEANSEFCVSFVGRLRRARRPEEQKEKGIVAGLPSPVLLVSLP